MEVRVMQSRWNSLFQQYAQCTHIAKGFNELVAKYSEKHRSYHNLHHINSCLEAFDEIIGDISDPFCIEVAIWFHDIIYNPKSTDNESMSAEYASSFLKNIGVKSKSVSKISSIIHLTKHPSIPMTEDEKYLLDIDLMILGAKPELYNQYENWIRIEYKDFPDLLYKEGRKKILNSILSQEHIFQTAFFKNRFEYQAKENINQALKKL